MRTFTPAEIRELSEDLCELSLVMPKTQDETFTVSAGEMAALFSLRNNAADALKYLLQFIEWKRIKDEKPSDPEQEVILGYAGSFTTANLQSGQWHALERNYRENTFDLWLPFVLPPQAEERNKEQDAAPERAFVGGTAVRGYMCLTDWEYEIGYSWKGNKVYPSLHALQDHHECWAECGVVEVEVRSIRTVVPEDHSEAIAAAILHAAPIAESADKPEA